MYSDVFASDGAGHPLRSDRNSSRVAADTTLLLWSLFQSLAVLGKKELE